MIGFVLMEDVQCILSTMSCSYAWPHTWWPITGMSIMPLRLMYVLKLMYIIKCFRIMACLGFQLCWRLYKRPSSCLLLLVFLKFFCQGKFLTKKEERVSCRPKCQNVFVKYFMVFSFLLENTSLHGRYLHQTKGLSTFL